LGIFKVFEFLRLFFLKFLGNLKKKEYEKSQNKQWDRFYTQKALIIEYFRKEINI
jgi:hypothetical protein